MIKPIHYTVKERTWQLLCETKTLQVATVGTKDKTLVTCEKCRKLLQPKRTKL